MNALTFHTFIPERSLKKLLLSGWSGKCLVLYHKWLLILTVVTKWTKLWHVLPLSLRYVLVKSIKHRFNEQQFRGNATVLIFTKFSYEKKIYNTTRTIAIQDIINFVQWSSIFFPKITILLCWKIEQPWHFACSPSNSTSSWSRRSKSLSILMHLSACCLNLCSNIRYCCFCWSNSLLRLSSNFLRSLGKSWKPLRWNGFHSDETGKLPLRVWEGTKSSSPD